jgi:hypothetical protein
VFQVYDYTKEDNCIRAIESLEKGEIELSHRHRMALDIYFDKINKQK